MDWKINGTGKKTHLKPGVQRTDGSGIPCENFIGKGIYLINVDGHKFLKKRNCLQILDE